MMTALFWTLFILFMLVCFILILLVLIQKGRGGGLSGRPRGRRAKLS